MQLLIHKNIQITDSIQYLDSQVWFTKSETYRHRYQSLPLFPPTIPYLLYPLADA